MDKAKSNPPVISLSIGTPGFQVSSEDVDLMNDLSRRYAEFLGAKTIHITIYIRVMGQKEEESLLKIQPAFESSKAYLKGVFIDGAVDLENGLAEIRLPDLHKVENAEYFLRIVTAMEIYRSGGILFHAAGIVRNGGAYLFFGHSGAGKSTIARYSQNDFVLNDDLVVIQPELDIWRVYATPFWNPTQVIPSNRSAELKQLFRLVQDNQVYLEPINPGRALAEMVANVPVIPSNPSWCAGLIERCQDLMRTTPVQLLHFLPDDSFWRVVDPGSFSFT
jgi:hypothetical protein